jgi:hypothetical protein
MLARIKAQHKTKSKFQETPAFSLRKTIPGARNRSQNKVIIDASEVAEEMAQKRNASLSKEVEPRRLYVTKGISSFSTQVNLGPQSNTFGILEDPK